MKLVFITREKRQASANPYKTRVCYHTPSHTVAVHGYSFLDFRARTNETCGNKTRQGYARKRILKPAGSSFLGYAS